MAQVQERTLPKPMLNWERDGCSRSCGASFRPPVWGRKKKARGIWGEKRRQENGSGEFFKARATSAGLPVANWNRTVPSRWCFAKEGKSVDKMTDVDGDGIEDDPGYDAIMVTGFLTCASVVLRRVRASHGGM